MIMCIDRCLEGTAVSRADQSRAEIPPAPEHAGHWRIWWTAAAGALLRRVAALLRLVMWRSRC